MIVIYINSHSNLTVYNKVENLSHISELKFNFVENFKKEDQFKYVSFIYDDMYFLKII